LKTDFLRLHRSAHGNAVELLSEAELLFEHRRYARAYALAFTALEEISKSQLAADVFTGFTAEDEFWKCYRDHKKKIARMAWATEDARRYLDASTETCLDVEKPKVASRMDALYVEFDGNTIQSPTDFISSEDAQGIIHTARTAIHRIVEMTEFWGHQIGTKGFMK
jgi:AbiV family abortive infection protein